MEITETFLRGLIEKFEFLQKQYFSECEEKLNNIQRSNLKLFYIKPYHCSDVGDMFSNSILRHVDAEKCLYKKPSAKIRKGADVNDYYMLYYNSNQELIMSESVYTHNFKPVTIYFDRNIQITYSVDDNKGSTQFTPQFRSLEYTEYINGNTVSCEKFTKLYQPPYGLEINGEYYEYDDEKLVKAIKIENYNTSYAPFHNPALKFGFVPKRILNPDIFSYEFKHDDSQRLICKKIHKYSSEYFRKYNVILEKSELDKLEKFGVKFFIKNRI